ncbi:hypothetical protein Tco_0702587 [Tanacetum coccineum]|uniref:Uncharacterized protein n=1 Tax=Tanacetum coccineum TaxID=301880 RepID=A0ABQ4XX14_9ASTR
MVSTIENHYVTAWVAEGGRMVLCYVQGSGRRKRKKGVGCGSRRQENYGSGRRDCGRIRIWDPRIKRVFQDNTLRTRRTTGVEDGIAVGLGYGIPESREFFKTTP